MNLKKLIVFLVLSVLFIPINVIFADDLRIEEGKNLKFDFKGDNIWYDDTKVYDKVNIGAGTRIVLDGECQYIFVSSAVSTVPIPRNRQVVVLGSTETITVQDEIYITTYTYRKDEIIATLPIKKDGELILNSGSELSLKNQYSLIASTQDISLGYDKNEKGDIVLKDIYASNIDDTFTYISKRDGEKEGDIDYKVYINRKLKYDEIDLFTGKITFEDGSLDTILTFQDFLNGKASVPKPSSSTIDDIRGHTPSGGNIIYRDYIADDSVKISSATKVVDDIKIYNDFQINSNRAVFNVLGTDRQLIMGKLGGSYLSGNGTIVKKGSGTIILSYEINEENNFVSGVIGNGLTGLNTGYAWQIEDGTLIAYKNDNLGTAGIFISSTSTLDLEIYSTENRFSTTTVIVDTETGKKFDLHTNCFSNNITSSSGTIVISSGSQIELSGNINTIDIDTDDDIDDNDLNFKFYKDSILVLSGNNNNAKNFNISFGSELGGESNYLITDVAGLPSGSVIVTTNTPSSLQQYSSFELVLQEDENTEYTGSLRGEMYLRKMGSGVVTLSGTKSSIKKGIYISEGGLVLAENPISIGNIWFDGGVKGDSTTYSSLSVETDVYDDYRYQYYWRRAIYVKNGAILNVEKDNCLYANSIQNYNVEVGSATEIIKTGSGEISTYSINISTINIKDGGFVLEKYYSSEVSNSYFLLEGQDSYLRIGENKSIKNNIIDILRGDLIIFNDRNISSTTAINFYSTETSTDSFSKLHITNNAVLSTSTISGKIKISNNIEFVTDATTKADLSKFIFSAGEDAIIVKSGTGTFIAYNNDRDFNIDSLYVNEGTFSLIDLDNFNINNLYLDDGNFNSKDINNFNVDVLYINSGNLNSESINNFNIDSLYVNGGNSRLNNTNINVSSTTVIDGGVLYISSTSKFISTGENKKITILNGGIGVYGNYDTNIDTDTILSFEGTDRENLSKLIIEGTSFNLTNDIYVKTGIIIENKNDLTFSGDSINFDSPMDNILVKAGSGKMTLECTDSFGIGELRASGGNLFVKSKLINVSTVSINAMLSLEEDNLSLVDNVYLSGTLSLYSPGKILDPNTVISDLESDEGLDTNIFSNDIILAKEGTISIPSSSKVELSGDIYKSTDTSTLKFSFYRNSALVLSGKTNNVEEFKINFGGEANYLIADVDSLASNSISATNNAQGDLKDYAFFELILKEDEDKEYNGLLSGEMYLRKMGSGIVTFSGDNKFTKGIYITEGGLVFKSTNSITSGNIWFDGGVKGDSTTYSSLSILNMKTDNIKISSNIYVKNGAILNVEEDQNLTLFGDIVSYDARPGYETEVIKTGLGKVKISSGPFEENRQINISTFNVESGGFILDKNMVLNSYFSLDGDKSYLKMDKDAGIKNNVIDIYSGDLIIFNENNISSATAINFHNTSNILDSFSKLHITSNTILSNETISSNINVSKNIEFKIDGTTIADLNKFLFNSGEETTIVKSGTGTFIVYNDRDFNMDSLYVNNGSFTLDSNENDLNMNNLYVNGIFNLDNTDNFNINNVHTNDGYIRLDNTSMNVSGTTIIDGGELYISSTSKFTSIGEDKKITVLRGNIRIYDDNSIDSETKLRFEGLSEKNLSKLIVEKDDVNLKNDMYVKTGLIIESNKNLNFSGSINYDPLTKAILAKAGEGTMTIDSDSVFRMGEIRILYGDLFVKSDIDVSVVSIVGENNPKLIFDNVNNANIKESCVMDNGILSISKSTVSITNLNLYSSNVSIKNSSVLNSNVINFNNSTIELHSTSSTINATEINLINDSYIKGYGNLNGTVNVNYGSNIYIGSPENTGEILKAKNVIFESGSNLYIDVSSIDGVTTTDKLEVSGDITVQKNSTLYVNLMGEESEYDTQKDFEFLTFEGNYNLNDQIFNVILSNPRFSAGTALLGKSIFLQISQEWFEYEIPGATKNQESMIDVFNKIYNDNIARNKMANVLSTLDFIYSNYRTTGDKTEFINAIQDLSSIFYANSFMTSAMLSKSNIIYSRLNDYYKEREETNRIWTRVYTNNFSVAENDDNPKFENNIYGMIAGYDTLYDENIVLGFAGFYGTGELKELKDKAEIQDAGANGYADYKINEKINVRGLVGLSLQNYDVTRVVKCMDNEAKSKYTNTTVNLDLEATYKFEFKDKFLLKPIVGANCAVVSNGEIEELGDAAYRLKINEGTYSKAEVRVGVGLQNKTESPFNWHISTAVKQIIIGDKFVTKSSFVKVPEYEFEIESTKLATTSFAGNIGCSYDIGSKFNVSLDLSADTGSASQFGANIGATYRW